MYSQPTGSAMKAVHIRHMCMLHKQHVLNNYDHLEILEYGACNGPREKKTYETLIVGRFVSAVCRRGVLFFPL